MSQPISEQQSINTSFGIHLVLMGCFGLAIAVPIVTSILPSKKNPIEDCTVLEDGSIASTKTIDGIVKAGGGYVFIKAGAGEKTYYKLLFHCGPKSNCSKSVRDLEKSVGHPIHAEFCEDTLTMVSMNGREIFKTSLRPDTNFDAINMINKTTGIIFLLMPFVLIGIGIFNIFKKKRSLSVSGSDV